MKYYLNTTLSTGFAEAIEKTTAALKEEGFGVLTTIDIRDKLKEKLNVDFRPYVILGACNPVSAYAALKVEDKIGTMLPCSVIVHETIDGKIEVAAIDPAAAMQSVGNPKLDAIAEEVRDKLKKVIARLG